MTLEQLPEEVLTTIAEFCAGRRTYKGQSKADIDGPTLKSLRLISRAFERRASPILFREYTIYPHIKSLEQLVELSNTSRLSHCVQKLIYDTRWRGTIAGFLAEALKDRKEPITDPSEDAFIERLEQAQQGILNSRFGACQIAPQALLDMAFENLRHSTHVTVREKVWGVEKSFKEVVPRFYENLFLGYKQYLRRDSLNEEPIKRGAAELAGASRSVVPSLLAAARKLVSCHTFRVDCVDWQSDWVDPDMLVCRPVYNGFLSRLKCLELGQHHIAGLYYREYYHDSEITTNLLQLLSMATNLERLAIRFWTNERCVSDTIGPPAVCYRSRSVPCRSVLYCSRFMHTSGLYRAQLTRSTKLESLKLEGLTCTLSEFEDVLSECASSLKTLCLWNLTMLPERRDGPRACLVKVLKWIRTNMSLAHFEVGGYWQNIGCQTWTFSNINETCKDTDLYHEVTAYITKGGKCPLEHVEIPEDYFDLGRKVWTKHRPKLLRDPTYWGDRSWNMKLVRSPRFDPNSDRSDYENDP